MVTYKPLLTWLIACISCCAHAQVFFTNGSNQYVPLCQGAGPLSLNFLLSASDTNAGGVLQWSVLIPCATGSLNGFNATATATGGTVTPTGLSYTPQAGITGPDSCVIVVRNLTDTTADTTRIWLNVQPRPTITLPGTNPAICRQQSMLLLPFSSTTGNPDKFSWSWGQTYPGFSNTINAAFPTGNTIPVSIPFNAPAGSYQASLTVSSSQTGCSSIPTAVSLSIHPLPYIVTDTVAACQGSSLLRLPYDSIQAGPNQYLINWMGAAGSQGFQPVSWTSHNFGQPQQYLEIAIPPAAPPGVYYGQLYVRNTTTGCIIAQPRTFKIVIHPRPTTGISTTAGPQSCSQQELRYYTLPGQNQYSWAFSGTPNASYTLLAGGTSQSDSAVLRWNHTGFHTVTVNYEDAHGCSLAVQASHGTSVNQSPALTSLTPRADSLCSGLSTNISLSASVSSTFYWTAIIPNNSQAVAGAFADSAVFSGINAPQKIQQALSLGAGNHSAPGTVWYRVVPVAIQSQGGCTGQPDTIRVNVQPRPVLTTTPLSYEQCSGASTTAQIQLSASTPGSSTYNWTVSNPGGILNAGPASGQASLNQNPATPTHTTPDTILYHITPVSDRGCAAAAPTNLRVKVYPIPVLTAATLAPKFSCSHAALNLELQDSRQGSSFSWTRIHGQGLSIQPDSAGPIIRDYISSNTLNRDTITYQVSMSRDGCPGSGQVQVVIYPRPRITTADKDICSGAGSALQLQAIPANATYLYRWTVTGNALGAAPSLPAGQYLGIDSINQQLINAGNSLPANATYHIQAMDSVLGCASDTMPVLLRVNPGARLAGISRSQVVCSEDSVELLPGATTSIAETRFAWAIAHQAGVSYPPPDTTRAFRARLSTNHSNKPAYLDLVYSLSYRNCISPDTIRFLVKPTPASPGITPMNPPVLCRGVQHMNLSALRPADADSQELFVWQAGNGASILQLDSLRARYVLLSCPQPGPVSISLHSYLRGYNCRNEARTITIDVTGHQPANPEVVYFHRNLVCLGQQIAGYQWGYDRKDDLSPVWIQGAHNQNLPFEDFGDTIDKWYWVMATLSDGCIRKAYLSRPYSLEVPHPAMVQNLALKAWPNPARDVLHISLDNWPAGPAEVVVYDLAGRSLVRQPMQGGTATLSLQTLSPGMYIAACYHQGRRLAATRFIKHEP